MRRAIRTLAVLALSAAAVVFVAAEPAPNYPHFDSQHGTQAMCLLDQLQLTNGISLLGSFNPTKFDYGCSCLDWSKIGYGAGSPSLDLHMMDFGSNAQVWFNGQPVKTAGLNSALYNPGTPGTSSAGNPASTGALATQANQWKVGDNLIQVLVGCHAFDPQGNSICEYQYTIKCKRPPAGGGFVTGDPQFVGLRGQNYQVHGMSGEVYNIVSDKELQYNSRFVFLTQGDCPVVDGRKQKGCFSHPGSYLGELGLKTKAGDRIHLTTGSAKRGFDSVTVNDKEVEVGETVILADDMGSVTRNTTHLASVLIGNWDFAFENSDMFVNQRVRVLDARSLRSHGLLGQTWRETVYPNSIKYVQGKVDDYVIRDGKIFGDNFLYNIFN